MTDTKTNDPSLKETITALSKNLVTLVKDFLELATLESRLAVKSLLTIIGLIFGVSMLMLTAWIFLVASLVYLLVTLGLSWPLALVLMASLNLLLVVPVMLWIVNLHHRIYFPITRKQLSTEAIKLSKQAYE